jgi:hypothetical protein
MTLRPWQRHRSASRWEEGRRRPGDRRCGVARRPSYRRGGLGTPLPRHHAQHPPECGNRTWPQGRVPRHHTGRHHEPLACGPGRYRGHGHRHHERATAARTDNLIATDVGFFCEIRIKEPDHEAQCSGNASGAYARAACDERKSHDDGSNDPHYGERQSDDGERAARPVRPGQDGAPQGSIELSLALCRLAGDEVSETAKI